MKISEIPSSLYYSLKLRLGNGKPPEPVQRAVPVILSLTSIPSRLGTLDITIKSLKKQDASPEKIILWLHEELKNQLPSRLEKLQDDLFEIRYSSYTFSHRKLIHAIQHFPDKVIITCDDDVIYPPDILSIIYEEHLTYPTDIIGNRCRVITYKDDELLSYNQWPFVSGRVSQAEFVMPVGAFCTLYPPHSLDHEVLDVDLFLKLAPKADDLWFKAMALKNGILSRSNSHIIKTPIPIIGTQKVALKKINKDQDFNRTQWLQICDHYGWDKEKIKDLV
jgi:hypothetical protein